MAAMTAKLKYLRIAPRKVRLVVNLLRGKKVEEAQTILNFTIKKASLPILKLLNQAVASAINNFQLDPANLFISKITVDEGPKYKRWIARARGSANEIQKKTSHITIVLGEIKKGKVKRKKVKAAPAEAVEEKEKKTERTPKIPKPRLKPETEEIKPKVEKSVQRIFRRKTF
ncbi:MAG: 50S ribosomal protein L22 [Candidatus Nealsonbacteria bacterium CG23_combo_of_CG06-09_8_20_14_all_39_25]|uniref:Large ribosomal subunit protein uL22 n=3 Tax=Candidatus Nealsoniibacteriota TaxID=1817911 RepID=A0A2G9YSG6_9BACT|nr:MAG: 50S ribosomal protein L22 [Candidatus Nealsonbacteria bacterium CG23_combo_of_CG06-09_8_20_14_all_39_25]PIQ98444.1 MAG: 50S ribosomal protein L22 [Candidatus Nealsonbacteria bacterium CG11_big_fil_rev_8_21_14_0_20_39_9]PIZ88357.1 MAG: 50S ribosomal protein L22 [Candidatus Nealsonbacteria bacterium CG_4_10_14_0_2_um_filter_39_15]